MIIMCTFDKMNEDYNKEIEKKIDKALKLICKSENIKNLLLCYLDYFK